MFSRLAVAFIATLAVSASAAPSKVFEGGDYASKIDYSPPITSPAGGEVFIAGQTASVTWDNTVVYDLSNVSTTADLVLGFTEEGSTSLNLDYTLKLDIPLYAPNPNSVDFQFPANLTTRDTYLLVLLGSTNNVSKKFTVISNPLGTTGTATKERRATPFGSKQRL